MELQPENGLITSQQAQFTMNGSGQLHSAWPTQVLTTNHLQHLRKNANCGCQHDHLYIEENGPLWSHGDLEKKWVIKDTTAKKMEAEEGVEIIVTANENEVERKVEKLAGGKAEKEEQEKTEKRYSKDNAVTNLP